MELEIGNIIAERLIDVLYKDGSKSDIKIKLGTPSNIPESNDVFAPYLIEYAGNSRFLYAVGIDGFQALQLAMKMIVADLESLQDKHNLEFFFGGQKIGIKSEELYGKWVLDEQSKTLLSRLLSSAPASLIQDTVIYLNSDGSASYHGYSESTNKGPFDGYWELLGDANDGLGQVAAQIRLNFKGDAGFRLYIMNRVDQILLCGFAEMQGISFVKTD